jgi:hypothetical protein
MKETNVLLIIEIALGIVLGVFLLWVIYAIVNYQSPGPVPKWEQTVWLVCIGGLTECVFDKEKGKGYCCRDMVYNPAFANTVHQFSTYEKARDWAKEMVNVRLVESWEASKTTYWHGNLEVREVTLPVATRWMEHRTADGKVDPLYLAECAARAKVAQEKQGGEEAVHKARMQERLARGQNQKA